MAWAGVAFGGGPTFQTVVFIPDPLCTCFVHGILLTERDRSGRINHRFSSCNGEASDFCRIKKQTSLTTRIQSSDMLTHLYMNQVSQLRSEIKEQRKVSEDGVIAGLKQTETTCEGSIWIAAVGPAGFWETGLGYFCCSNAFRGLVFLFLFFQNFFHPHSPTRSPLSVSAYRRGPKGHVIPGLHYGKVRLGYPCGIAVTCPPPKKRYSGGSRDGYACMHTAVRTNSNTLTQYKSICTGNISYQL